MTDTVKVSAAVSGREIGKFLIRRLSKRKWERVIEFATIDKERCSASLDVTLQHANRQEYEDMSANDAHPSL